MPDVISKIPQQLSGFWSNLEKGNKIKIVVSTVVVFLSVIIAIFIVSRPQYQSLFSTKLDPLDVSEVKNQLEKVGISHRITGGGTSIEVQKKDFDLAKVSLAETDVLKKGMTYQDVLKNTTMGQTAQEKTNSYHNYLEIDLATSLQNYIDDVKEAKVKLAIPDNGAFAIGTKEPSTASAIINSDYTLTSNQILAIQKFIAASVENLDSKDVVVLDKNGNMLSEDPTQSGLSEIDKKMDYARRQTESIQKSVADLLADTADKVKVVANLDIDYNSSEQIQTQYQGLPDNSGIRSESTKEESIINNAEGGVPGTDTNPEDVPPTYPVNDGDGNSQYNLSEGVRNYELDQTYTTTITTPGKIVKENSSIAVALYNQQIDEQAAGGNVATAAVQRLPVDVNVVKAMVANATGIPAAKVTVQTFPYIPEPIPVQTFTVADFLNEYGAYILITLLLLLILLSLLIRRKSEETVEEEAEEVEELELADEIPSIPGLLSPDEVPDIDTEEKSQIKKQLDKFVQQKPEAVAQLLRNWLADDWE